MRWTCQQCGSDHDELPLCFGSEAPWRTLVPDTEFSERVMLNADLCVVDDRVFFIRGHIELPIVGANDTFAWSVWCSLSEKSFEHCQSRWNDPSRSGDGYFGWLSTALPGYPNTTHLQTDVICREPGVVPSVRLHQVDHPLFHEQTRGITWARVREIAHALLHTPTTH